MSTMPEASGSLAAGASPQGSCDSQVADASITEALLGRGQQVRVVPSGTSMLPLLDGVADSVVIDGSQRDYIADDLVLYRDANGQLVLHRVWEAGSGIYTMLGDGNIAKEPGILASATSGRAVEITRRGKTFPVTAPRYRLYCKLWRALYPIRRFLIRR